MSFGARLAGTRRALGTLVFVIALIGATSSAQAAKSYTFDPVLSLTGSCSTTAADTVPDPGCPGGEHPPSGAFKSPRSIATDSYGDIYVASYGSESENGKGGRIDIFDSEGFFLTELLEPAGPKDIAVDSKGNLYVFNASSGSSGKVIRYEPSVYDPEAGEIKYGKAGVLITENGAFLSSLAVNPLNDHLFLKRQSVIAEYGSAEEGNKLLEEFGEEVLNGFNGLGLAIDAAHGKLYAADYEKVRVFELASPHKLLQTIEGSELPTGALTFEISVAADESTGNFFLFSGSPTKSIYEFNEAGKFIATVKTKLLAIFGSEVSVDNGPLSPHPGYLFAPNEEGGRGISYAFEPPPPICAPQIESISFSNVSQEDAELQATVNPCGSETEFTFEYTTQERFEEEGFAGASIAGEGSLPAGKVGVKISAAAAGLSPETTYRFRVIATNEAGTEEAESEFTTYPALGVIESCPNDATRTGLSALLPDCRAYELVTPPDTNARTPRGIGKTDGIYFATREASPAGDKVSFITEGGSLPGLEGTGSLSGDAYLATRGPSGWSTTGAGPNGEEAAAPLTGSTSPDQGYSFWTTGSSAGSAGSPGEEVSYLRYPDEHSEVIGRGSIATDRFAAGQLISENGSHVVFSSVNFGSHTAIQLEPNAPPNGTQTVYDRTIDQATGEEETHVVSLLPGDATPAAGQNATYQGASLDGKGIAFSIGNKLYLRFNDEETYEAGEDVTFAGVSEGGARIFYLEGGNLFAFDAKAEEAIQFTGSGDVTPVNVAAEGIAAYFVSPSVLTGEANPNGATAQAGKENLYRSEEGQISFVGVVTDRDVEGEFGGTEQAGGLGLWTAAVGPNGNASGRLGIDPSRTTPDGNALLFESRADLAGYDPEGHAEVYRYDSAEGVLQCLSCNPTQAPASGESSLQSVLQEQGGPEPFRSFAFVKNLRDDGRRAFFQSSEPLVVGDTDGLQDVYEWEAQGVGSCTRPGGCIYLISSGHSDRVDYLYAVSDSGEDVFFRSSDLLLPSDTESTPSIYDAKVGGGFALEPETCRIDQDCGGTVTPAPALGAPASEALGPPDNFVPPKKCPKGKRKVTKNGKTSCVKKRHHRRKHHRASSKRKGAGE